MRKLTVFEQSLVYTNEGYKIAKDLPETFEFTDIWGDNITGTRSPVYIEDHRPCTIDTAAHSFLLPAHAVISVRELSAKFSLISLQDLDTKVGNSVLRPSRKLSPRASAEENTAIRAKLFQKLDLGSKQELIFNFEQSPGDVFEYAAYLNEYGVSWDFDEKTSILSLDSTRIPCFPSKLLSGVFHGPDAELAFAELVGGGGIKQTKNWDTYWKIAQRNVIPEGSCIGNLIFILGRQVHEYKKNAKQMGLVDLIFPHTQIEVNYLNM